MDSKQRKIRSLRGFFLYVLEIMEKGEDYEILKTNLQPFFWRKVKNVIRRNKKTALHEFLFGSQSSDTDITNSTTEFQSLKERMESLQNQVNSLQDRICDLETTPKNSNYALSGTIKPPEMIKTNQPGDCVYLLEDNPNLQQGEEPISKSVSEASKSPLKPLSGSNISYNQKKQQNQSNFRTLGKILEDEQIEIIKLGFQLQAEGKISLKKYYQSTDPYSLFQSKGYQIKYESIRRTKLYQQLKFQL